MARSRDSRRLVIVSLLVLAAFALGAVFGALGFRFLPRPSAHRRVPSDPGLPSDFLADPIPAEATNQPSGVHDRVPGNGTATPPAGYPIKGNARSGIYHVPGGFAYHRTVATEHYRTVVAAEAAGLRASKH